MNYTPTHVAPSRARLPACMGGFCAQRDRCGQHLTNLREIVVERLCVRGLEQPQPVLFEVQQPASMEEFAS